MRPPRSSLTTLPASWCKEVVYAKDYERNCFLDCTCATCGQCMLRWPASKHLQSEITWLRNIFAATSQAWAVSRDEDGDPNSVVTSVIWLIRVWALNWHRHNARDRVGTSSCIILQALAAACTSTAHPCQQRNTMYVSFSQFTWFSRT